MDPKDLTIVITTFKSEAKIYSCLNSIPKHIRILIIENSSNTEFKNLIESKYPNIECYLTGDNKGYAVANNIGLSKVTSKYALVLNPDTTLTINAIENFLKAAEENKDFWLMGPANNQVDKNITKILKKLIYVKK